MELQQIIERAREISLDLLPAKSKDVYLRTYRNFMTWKQAQNIDEHNFCEEVMIVYFQELSGVLI